MNAGLRASGNGLASTMVPVRSSTCSKSCQDIDFNALYSVAEGSFRDIDERPRPFDTDLGKRIQALG
jgi:hypothetical protein